jgi:hypothetical protein
MIAPPASVAQWIGHEEIVKEIQQKRLRYFAVSRQMLEKTGEN